MSLTEKISADLIAAMKGGDKVALEAIRAAKTAFLLAKSEKGQEALTSDEELKVIQKLVKQRRESAEIYNQNNRPELAQKETAEADILAKYLPEKISPAELEKVLKDIIAKTGAKTAADMGKVMGLASKELAGRADGREISAKVKELLSQ